MTVLIAGGTGLLGRALAQRLEHPGGVLRTGHSRASGGAVGLDARDAAAVDALVDQVRPDVVVNSVGERRPEYWPDEAALEATNVTAAVNLARACARHGAWLIHISSDYVFDGNDPPYHPDDERRPLNAYGWSKLRAEDAVRAADPGATVLRLPVLYGPVEHLDEANLTSLVPAVLDRTAQPLDDWAVRYPTLTTDVAEVVAGMLAHRDTLSGRVCHWTATEGLTKYQMAVLIGRTLGVPADHLTPDPRPAPTRPRDALLDTSLLDGLGVGRRTPLDEALPGLLPARSGG